MFMRSFPCTCHDMVVSEKSKRNQSRPAPVGRYVCITTVCTRQMFHLSHCGVSLSEKHNADFIGCMTQIQSTNHIFLGLDVMQAGPLHSTMSHQPAELFDFSCWSHHFQAGLLLKGSASCNKCKWYRQHQPQP